MARQSKSGKRRGCPNRFRCPPCLTAKRFRFLLKSIAVIGNSFSMTHAQAKARHAELVEEIRKHDHAYYVEAQPVISDQEYDRLYRELLDLEKAFPDLVTPDSPSQRVGGVPLTEFKAVQHLSPMMSLDNTYSQEEVREFVARVQL